MLPDDDRGGDALLRQAQDRDAHPRPGPPRAVAGHAGARGPRGARHPDRAALPRGARARALRDGLLLGRRAHLLAGAGRLHARRSATPAATRRTRPTRRSAPGGPATTRSCGWSSTPPSRATTRCCSASGRATTRPRACARATTWAPSTGRASTSTRTPSAPRPSARATRTRSASRTPGYGAITTEIVDAPEFYYAEDYHQQYLAKIPNGYCGLGGTGVSCPVGVVAAD